MYTCEVYISHAYIHIYIYNDIYIVLKIYEKIYMCVWLLVVSPEIYKALACFETNNDGVLWRLIFNYQFLYVIFELSFNNGDDK